MFSLKNNLLILKAFKGHFWSVTLKAYKDLSISFSLTHNKSFSFKAECLKHICIIQYQRCFLDLF